MVAKTPAPTAPMGNAWDGFIPQHWCSFLTPQWYFPWLGMWAAFGPLSLWSPSSDDVCSAQQHGNDQDAFPWECAHCCSGTHLPRQCSHPQVRTNRFRVTRGDTHDGTQNEHGVTQGHAHGREHGATPGLRMIMVLPERAHGHERDVIPGHAHRARCGAVRSGPAAPAAACPGATGRGGARHPAGPPIGCRGCQRGGVTAPRRD